MASGRRFLLLAVLVAPLAACGKKGEPDPPSGRKTVTERPYPKPDPVPWQTDEQQKQRKK